MVGRTQTQECQGMFGVAMIADDQRGNGPPASCKPAKQVGHLFETSAFAEMG